MRTIIDAEGRLVVPKLLRDELGFTPGTELELTAIDGRLEVAVPTHARVEEGHTVSGSRPARATT
jgi:AbrB family looped-hinge helix DNA binding protein